MTMNSTISELMQDNSNVSPETKALLAEEQEKVNNLERTKAQIGDKKVASAMGTAGAKSKEYEGVWMTAREWCIRHKLQIYANEPKWTVSNRLADICMAYPEREQWHMNNYGTCLFPKWACDMLDKVYDDDSTFLRRYRTK